MPFLTLEMITSLKMTSISPAYSFSINHVQPCFFWLKHEGWMLYTAAHFIILVQFMQVFKRARAQCLSCVHSNQINWTFGSSIPWSKTSQIYWLWYTSRNIKCTSGSKPSKTLAKIPHCLAWLAFFSALHPPWIHCAVMPCVFSDLSIRSA